MTSGPALRSSAAHWHVAIDRPGEDVEDRFSREPFVDQISRFLFSEKEYRATGCVVGLTGPWGSGKSQTLIFIKKKLKSLIETAARAAPPDFDGRTIVVNFNPWLYSSRDEVMYAFFNLIRGECSKDRHLADIVSIFKRWEGWIAKGQKIVGAVSPTVGGLFEAFMRDEPSLEEQKEQITEFFTRKHSSVIVIVDEIDRLSDDEVRGMAQVIKSIADFPMFSYLLSYDPERVARALGNNDTKLGHFYLEKIVQVQLRVPRVPPQVLIRYIADHVKPMLLAAHHDSWSQAEADAVLFEAQLERVLRALVPGVLSTPRDARRLAAACAARLRFVGREVDLFDLLGYCALETRVPMLSERLQHLVPRVTIDGFREMTRQAERHLPAEACIDRILGEFSDESPLRDLLVYLFPALRSKGTETVATEDTRLCYTTPLMTLLNYDRLPGTTDRNAAFDAVSAPDTKLHELLAAAVQNGLLRHTILRLRSTMRASKSKEEEIASFWRLLGAFFDKPIAREDLADNNAWLDLTHAFVRGAFRGFFRTHPISHDFVESLIAGGYVHLPSRILDFSARALGLFDFGRDHELKPLLSVSETQRLIESASNAVAQAIAQDHREAKWRLRSVIPLWVLKLGDHDRLRWTSALSQLSTPANQEALDAVLILMHRSRGEGLHGQSLSDLLDLESVARQWLALDRSHEEISILLDEAYRFFQEQFHSRRPANGA